MAAPTVNAVVYWSKSTLYMLADSKERLGARCVERYFRRAAHRVEQKVDGRRTAATRLRTYLLAVADELDTASDALLSDVAAKENTSRSYERHTQIAAERVRELVKRASVRVSSTPFMRVAPAAAPGPKVLFAPSWRSRRTANWSPSFVLARGGPGQFGPRPSGRDRAGGSVA